MTHVAADEPPASGIGVSIIAPPAYLRDFVAQAPPTVHHVAAQHVLHDPSYRAFFREESEMGAAVIVDNGVFDLGESLDAAELVRAAKAVSAKEIILPDVMRNGLATMRASDRAALEISRLTDEFQLCAVVHATDDSQWLRCYEHFATSDYVSTIALPASRDKQPMDGLCRNRVKATSYLQEHQFLDPRLTYRLLGLGRLGHLELFEQRQYTWIASVDCAAPVVLGSMGVRMEPDGPYQKIPTPRIEALPPIDTSRFPLIRQNIRAVRYAANCSIEIREAP